MNPMLQFVPLLVMIGVYTAIVKLSAVVCRFRLGWLHSLFFALVLTAAIVAARILFALTQISIPLAVDVIVGTCVNLVLGGWFLRERATRRSDGRPAGVAGGMRISAVIVVMFGSLTLLLTGILGYVTRSHG